MKLLLDEMHAPAVAAEMRQRGYDAVAVKERPDLVGLADKELLQIATHEERAVVTENVKDFAALHASFTATGLDHAGIVFTRAHKFPRSAGNHVDALATALGEFVQGHAHALDGTGSFVWWL